MSLLEPRCSFCHNSACDSVEIEGGNNAEKTITVDLCEGCLLDMETNQPGFDKKHAETLDRLFNESGGE